MAACSDEGAFCDCVRDRMLLHHQGVPEEAVVVVLRHVVKERTGCRLQDFVNRLPLERRPGTVLFAKSTEACGASSRGSGQPSESGSRGCRWSGTGGSRSRTPWTSEVGEVQHFEYLRFSIFQQNHRITLTGSSSRKSHRNGPFFSLLSSLFSLLSSPPTTVP